MHAFIITGGSQVLRQQFVSDKNTILSELIHLTAEKSSITIKQIQELNGPLSISARIPRIIWIEEANQITIPAQNALLKMLEEPPVNTTFYLTCNSQTSLLPTIRSRSKIIALDGELTQNDPSILADLKNVMSMTPGDRLANIVKRDRAESIVWMQQIESALRDKLHEESMTKSSYSMLSKIATSALSAHLSFAGNCSVGLVTQHFYLTLPHTRASQ